MCAGWLSLQWGAKRASCHTGYSGSSMSLGLMVSMSLTIGKGDYMRTLFHRGIRQDDPKSGLWRAPLYGAYLYVWQRIYASRWSTFVLLTTPADQSPRASRMSLNAPRCGRVFASPPSAEGEDSARECPGDRPSRVNKMGREGKAGSWTVEYTSRLK